MILLRFMLLLCVAPSVAACGSNFVRSDNPLAGPTQDAVPPDTVISLERGPCFGTCPIYKLTIYSDGSVVFEGMRHVRTTGRASGRISREGLRRLISEFGGIDYFSLSDSYGEVAVVGHSPEVRCPKFATDMPSVTTSIRINGRSKSVYHNHGCGGLDKLKGLRALESKIDEAADSKRWVE